MRNSTLLSFVIQCIVCVSGFLFCPAFSVAQNQELIIPGSELTSFLEEHPAELVYVHTDRDMYVLNDTLWFKIYLTDAHIHVPKDGYRNVYVEMLDESGEQLLRKLVLINEGFGMGDMCLSEDKFGAGTFILRAYTNYQQNFGSEFIFRKRIKLEDLYKIQATLEDKEVDKTESKSIDLQFLPEGGYLTSNLPNILSFKAIDSEGNSINVSGSIMDEANDTVARFGTTHNGMGKLKFIPRQNALYKASIDGYPEIQYELPRSNDQLNFTVNWSNDTTIVINLAKNTFQSEKIKYNLICSSGGLIHFHFPFEMGSSFKQIKLKASQMAFGINQLTLTDAQLRPFAERLVFMQNGDFLDVDLDAQKTNYGQRDKVNVKVSTSFKGQMVPSNLSVSVVNQRQDVLLDDHPQNILSYLLLDSQLKGNIENPSYYFTSKEEEVIENLDLLMLTHGWRAYNWNQFAEELPSSGYQVQRGLAINGRLKKLIGKKGVDNGRVSLFLKSDKGGVYFDETISDSLGNFEFGPLVIPDSASAFIQGLNKRDKKYTEILDIKTLSPTAMIDSSNLEFHSTHEIDKADFVRKATLQLAAEKEFNPEKYNILLDEIVVNKKTNPLNENNDKHSRAYGMADNVLVIGEEASSYADIWSYINGRVAGVMVSGNEVSIRGADTPHFLLDGIPVEKEMLDGIPLTEVDKIEVLKDAVNLAVFGTKGGNGVIAVYTKRGDASYVKEEFYSGILSKTLEGYSIARVFYSPDYKKEPTEKPDHRATIYWNPNVLTDESGEGKISFFTTDDLDPVLIKVEGINAEGRLGVGVAKVYVE